MCRQSDFVPLPSLLERFLVSGARYTQFMSAQALSAKEKELMFEQVDADDLTEMDLVDQKAFVDSVAANVSTSTKEPTQPVKQDAPETKPETAENA